VQAGDVAWLQLETENLGSDIAAARWNFNLKTHIKATNLVVDIKPLK
jgi:hypothetical protein